MGGCVYVRSMLKCMSDDVREEGRRETLCMY